MEKVETKENIPLFGAISFGIVDRDSKQNSLYFFKYFLLPTL